MKKISGVVLMGMLLMPGAVFAQTEDMLVPAAEPETVVSVPEPAPAAEIEPAPETAPDTLEDPDLSAPESDA